MITPEKLEEIRKGDDYIACQRYYEELCETVLALWKENESLRAVAKAADEYRKECEMQVPDLALRKALRAHLFDALASLKTAEEGK